MESPKYLSIREAARTMGILLVAHLLHAPFNGDEYRRLFAATADEGADAIYVVDQPENLANRRLLLESIEKRRIPAIIRVPTALDWVG